MELIGVNRIDGEQLAPPPNQSPEVGVRLGENETMQFGPDAAVKVDEPGGVAP
jgi:hypothetical protein